MHTQRRESHSRPERSWASLVGLAVLYAVMMLVLRLVGRWIGWWEGSTVDIVLFSAVWGVVMVLADVVARIRRRRAAGGRVRHNGEHE